MDAVRRRIGRGGMPGQSPRAEQTWRRPQLRPVEVLPTVVDGPQLYCLRDHIEPDGPPLLVSREGLLLLSLMDGERDLGRLCTAFLLRTGQPIAASQVEEFVRRLDDA
jgi:hypothetical protein